VKPIIIKLLLLLSLSFNITHAAFIAIEDNHTGCHHDTVETFVMELSVSDECGDLCDMHHLFHFMAIIETPLVTFDTRIVDETPLVTKTLYDTSIQQTDTKPPIA
jgi:S-ribosylhomocysteine lyase LuxS involved in autoinducer biosynthesis